MNISINENKHTLIAKIMLIATLLLTILQVVLSVVSLPWDTFYFAVQFLPVLITCFILLKYKTIINGDNYQRLLTLPIVLVLATHTIILFEEIKGLSFYSENPIIYSITTWEYICLYALNCGPSIIAIATVIIASILCLLKKQKNILASIFMGISAVVQLADGVALLTRGAEIYVRQFGTVYVLFLALSTLVNVLVFITFSVLMLPTKAEDAPSSC